MISEIKKDRQTFQDEQNELLKTILDARFFKPWSKEYNNPSDVPVGALELFLTSYCNQKCEYCYLIKHEGLYPKEYNNKTLIMKNLAHIFDWILNENYHIPMVEFYTGEIWSSEWGIEVLDLALTYIKKGMQVDQFLIPSNCSFLMNKEQSYRIQQFIDEFKLYGSSLVFSLSVDGKIIEEKERPLNNGEIKTDDFYESLFMFAKHNNFGFHPMLSANSAKYWIENYKWWKKMLHKYDMTLSQMMLLEVRSDTWTEENIKDYQKFLRYMIDDIVNFHGEEYFDYAVEDLLFCNQTYVTDPKEPLIYNSGTPYIPIVLPEIKGYYGCTISTSLTLRVGDLALCPCHRSAYNKYLFGWLTQDENGDINGIKANNPQMAIPLYILDKNAGALKCDCCIYNNYCLGICCGHSIEQTGDPFRQVDNTCHFLQEKFKFLIKTYKEIGLLDWLEKNITPYHVFYPQAQRLQQLYKNVLEEENNERLEERRQAFYG